MATQVQDLVRSYQHGVDAWNDGHDLDGVVRQYHVDAVLHDHAQQRRVEGHDQLRQWMSEWGKAFPDSTMATHQAMTMEDWTIVRFRTGGSNDGPLGPLEPTGRHAEMEGCSVARWKDGRIVEEHWCYDLYGLLAKLGHVPEMSANAGG